MKNVDALDLDKLLQDDLKTHNLESIIDLIARMSWWIDPKVYHFIQIVYPKTRRKKGIQEKRSQIIDGIMLWDNQPASQAF